MSLSLVLALALLLAPLLLDGPERRPASICCRRETASASSLWMRANASCSNEGGVGSCPAASIASGPPGGIRRRMGAGGAPPSSHRGHCSHPGGGARRKFGRRAASRCMSSASGNGGTGGRALLARAARRKIATSISALPPCLRHGAAVSRCGRRAAVRNILRFQFVATPSSRESVTVVSPRSVVVECKSLENVRVC